MSRLIILIFFISASASSDDCRELRDYAKNKTELKEMLAIIREQQKLIEPEDTNRKNRLFSGSVDWHSAVHSRWAELRLNRFLDGRPSEKERQKVRDWFKIKDLQHELNLQLVHIPYGDKSEERREVPYGIVWFLQFLDELNEYGMSDAELKPLRDRALKEVVDWLDDPKYRSDFYGRCIGDHSSWELNYFLLKNTRAYTQIDESTRDRIKQTWLKSPCQKNTAESSAPFIDLEAIIGKLDQDEPRKNTTDRTILLERLGTNEDVAVCIKNWSKESGLQTVDYYFVDLLKGVYSKTLAELRDPSGVHLDQEMVTQVNDSVKSVKLSHEKAIPLSRLWVSMGNSKNLKKEDCSAVLKDLKKQSELIRSPAYRNDRGPSHYLPQFFVYGLSLSDAQE